jgi:hypothetical protein
MYVAYERAEKQRLIQGACSLPVPQPTVSYTIENGELVIEM